MTRAEAIRALADKVREVDYIFSDDWIFAWEIVSPEGHTYSMKSDGTAYAGVAWKAYKGSLDAAKALHEAVLPGWSWMVDGDCNATVYSPGERLPHDGRAAAPARSWLLAILAALEAIETGSVSV